MSTLPHWADPAVPDSTLDPQGLSRRGILRRAGLFGAAFAATTALPATAPAAATPAADDPELVYLVGDHHVHTQYSHDAKYTLAQAARRGAQYGLDWMVCTEHSNVGHDTIGARAGANRHRGRARREPAPADLPGPGVVHPGRRARHGLHLTR